MISRPNNVRHWHCLLLTAILASGNAFQPSIPVSSSRSISSSASSTSALFINKREIEIRRKIAQLKKQGKLKRNKDDDYDDDDDDDEIGRKPDRTDLNDAYGSRIRQKLGTTKSRILGFDATEADDDDLDEEEEEIPVDDSDLSSRARLGTLPSRVIEEESTESSYKKPTQSAESNWINPELFGSDDEDDKDEDPLEDEDLLDRVAEKMLEKRRVEEMEKNKRSEETLKEKRRSLEAEAKQSSPDEIATSSDPKQLTSGVGGSWAKTNTTATATEDVYQPKSGSWGAFPRPRDISKAYGGGRRVGPGYSNEEARQASTEATRDKLRAYRERVGIEVESEKEHAAEIEEALNIGTLAMQRGIYTTAVSALEKVTKYCSTNSKVGGKVFLELAMAYEAAGRTDEAIQIYQTLSKCRMEDIKYNAKRLLYGIEAMQFMRNEVKSSAFSRKEAKNVFIDTTGLANIADAFDDRYNMAYLDLSKGDYYKSLSEAVVRSPREARQILLKAVGPGEVSRLRIVQALRSVSRNFDTALADEIERNTVVEPVAVMDGKPILRRIEDPKSSSATPGIDDFILAQPDQMKENLGGEWRLQCLADKKGDGVTFFNQTLAWQALDTSEAMKFDSSCPVGGLVSVKQSGGIEFNDKRRILRRSQIQVSGGGILTGLFGGTSSGVPASVATPQQVLSVDSTLLITRGVPPRRGQRSNDQKNYFAVWRKVKSGTFS